LLSESFQGNAAAAQGWGGKKTSSFLKKRSKKLLLLRCSDRARVGVNLRGAKPTKVFWFFFSKKNTSCLTWCEVVG
jgi:hypothetical protein